MNCWAISLERQLAFQERSAATPERRTLHDPFRGALGASRIASDRGRGADP